MKLIHMWYPNSRQDEKQETLDFLETAQDFGGYEVEHSLNLDDLDYSVSLRYNWNLGEPFFILEDDKVPTIEILDEMANCPEKLCVANYILNSKKMGIMKGVSAHRNIVEGNPSLIKKLEHITTEEYADLYGFGLVKFVPFGRYPWAPHTWVHIDIRVSKWTAMQGIKAHVHGMVKHNHV